MRFLIAVFAAVYIASMISDGLGRDADVALEIYLDQEQQSILTRLEAKNDANVSRFVQDWRRSYPKASPEKLQDLRLVEQKIDNDISTAAQFTLAAHKQKLDQLNGAISAPFGGTVEPQPGL